MRESVCFVPAIEISVCGAWLGAASPAAPSTRMQRDRAGCRCDRPYGRDRTSSPGVFDCSRSTSRPRLRSSFTTGFGMLPQPMPASSRACLAPRSASRQLFTDQHAEIAATGQFANGRSAPVECDRAAAVRGRPARSDLRQRMIGRRHRQHLHRAGRPAGQKIIGQIERPADAEHRLSAPVTQVGHCAKGLDPQTQGDGGKTFLRKSSSALTSFCAPASITSTTRRDFRFQARCQPPRFGEQPVQRDGHAPGCPPGWRGRHRSTWAGLRVPARANRLTPPAGTPGLRWRS